MDLIDKYLLPRVEREIETETDGTWLLSVRPRRFGPPVKETSMVGFRRPGAKLSSGFGVRLWALEKMTERDEDDWIVTSSLTMTSEMARQAMAWIKEIKEGQACR